MNPKIFGWEHITYFIIVILLMISSIFLITKYVKKEKTQTMILKIFSLFLFLSILANRICIIVEGDLSLIYLIPHSYCGMSSLVLSLAVLLGKKDNPVLHFVWFLALLGGVITLIYPDFIGQSNSIFYPNTITGLLHHTLSVFVVILLFITKSLHVTYKKWYCTLFGFTSYLTIGGFLITVFNYSDAFYMLKPILSGTFLNTWVLAPIYIILYSITLLIFELFKKKHD